MDCFDAAAKDFDTDWRIDRARIIADKIRTHIAVGCDRSAIEYGCGTGLVGFELINDFKTLLLIDSSPEMIKQAEQKLGRLGSPTASTLRCDFTEGVPETLRADYVFSSLVIHHIKDTMGILRRFYDVLNGSGHLLIVDVDEEDGSFHAKYPDFDGHNGFSHTALVDSALNAGFATATAETFFHDAKTFNGKKNPYSLFILDAVK